MSYPKITEPDRVLELAKTELWESEGTIRSGGPVGGWLRAWPSGHVHYSEDWMARLDGRFDTACCRTRVFWPQDHWPEAKICPQCAAVFRGLARAEARKP